ncbi:hypothetical protein GCM10007079_01240 [Nocardiopsis terrae]|nr:hypothetical protein GCM10007079_01240 [Nocardiopsis terrae]
MRRAPCVRPVEDWGAAHARVTRRLTGTITQATAYRTGGQNGVRHGETSGTGSRVAVGHP